MTGSRTNIIINMTDIHIKISVQKKICRGEINNIHIQNGFSSYTILIFSMIYH